MLLREGYKVQRVLQKGRASLLSSIAALIVPEPVSPSDLQPLGPMEDTLGLILKEF